MKRLVMFNYVTRQEISYPLEEVRRVEHDLALKLLGEKDCIYSNIHFTEPVFRIVFNNVTGKHLETATYPSPDWVIGFE